MIYYLKVSRWLISKAVEIICKNDISTAKDGQDHKTFGIQNILLCPEMSNFSSYLVAVSGRAVNGCSFRECWAQCLRAFSICRVWKVNTKPTCLLRISEKQPLFIQITNEITNPRCSLPDKSDECSMPEGQKEWLIMGYVLNVWFLSPSFSSSFIKVDFQAFREMS